MNRMFLYISVLMLSGCFSTMPIKEAELNTQYVIDLAGNSKDEIYAKSLDFIAYSYKDAKAVINVQDKERCKIIGKGIGPNYHERALVDPNLSYTYTIQCKEEKVRITYSNLMADRWYQGQHYSYPPHATNVNEVQDALNQSARQFEGYFKEQSSDDNW